MLIEMIRNSLTLLGINPFWQGTFVGTFIIVAVLFDMIRHNREAIGSLAVALQIVEGMIAAKACLRKSSANVAARSKAGSWSAAARAVAESGPVASAVMKMSLPADRLAVITSRCGRTIRTVSLPASRAIGLTSASKLFVRQIDRMGKVKRRSQRSDAW